MHRFSFSVVVCIVVTSGWNGAAGGEVNWRLVTPKYPIEDTLVCGFSVKDFNAAGDGKTDDTQAFQNALDAMGKAGGGTVFVPEGHYALKGNLRIPVSVTLRGEWKKPVENLPLRGTVLKVYPGKGSSEGTPFITLNYCSGFKDMALWYPEQNAASVVPYPFAVRQLGGDNATCENVTFVNAYQGIDIGPNFNELHYLHHIYGTFLKLGIRFDVTTDIGRLETIHLSPDYWIRSQLPGAPARPAAFKKWMRENSTAIHMLRSDWEYGIDVSVEGYHTGLLISGSPRGYPNAQFSDFRLIDCTRPLYIKGSNKIGLAFTRCRFEGTETACETSDAFNAIAQFHDCSFKGAKTVVNNGSGHLSFQHCSFLQGALEARTGTLTVVDCTFKKAACSVRIGTRVAAASLLSNRFEGAPDVVNQSDGDIKINHKQRDFPRLPETFTSKLMPVKPMKHRLYCVTDPAWGARGDGRTDDTAAIQKALDATGKNGGGIVFVPPADYRLDGSLTVPRGVELRGIHEVPHHPMGAGSILLVKGGKGDAGGTPTVILKEKSILRGLMFHYPDQSPTDPVDYPWTIQGRGAHIAIINVTASNPSRFVDLATHRCDFHYLDYVSGAPLDIGIHTGGGSAGGTVRNTQFNPHYWGRVRRKNAPRGRTWEIFWRYQKENLDAFILGDCRNVVQFQNFVYGSLYGIHLVEEKGRGPSGTILGHGTDGSKVSARVDCSGAERIAFINAELVCMASENKRYIHLGKQAKGHAVFFNTLLWGDPDLAGIIEAGTLTVQQANFLRHKEGFRIEEEGTLHLTNSFFHQGGPIATQDISGADFFSTANVLKKGLITNMVKELIWSMGDIQREPSLPWNIKTISVTLSKRRKKRGMSFVARTGESNSQLVVKQGLEGRQCLKALARDNVRYMYFNVDHEPFKNGRTPQVLLTIEYFDEGTFAVKAVYDSSDRSVHVTSAAGAWKPAGAFRTKNTGTWKSVSFPINDALFDNRLNGHDLRLEIGGPHSFTVRSVTLSCRT